MTNENLQSKVYNPFLSREKKHAEGANLKLVDDEILPLAICRNRQQRTKGTGAVEAIRIGTSKDQ